MSRLLSSVGQRNGDPTAAHCGRRGAAGDRRILAPLNHEVRHRNAMARRREACSPDDQDDDLSFYSGIIAASTNSLPEALESDLNWDYRYCLLCDAAFTITALLDAGYQDEAKAFRDWLLRWW